MGNLTQLGLLVAQAATPQATAVAPVAGEGYQWGLVLGVTLALLAGLLYVCYFTRTGIIARSTTMEATRQPLFLLLMNPVLVISKQFSVVMYPVTSVLK